MPSYLDISDKKDADYHDTDPNLRREQLHTDLFELSSNASNTTSSPNRNEDTKVEGNWVQHLEENVL